MRTFNLSNLSIDLRQVSLTLSTLGKVCAIAAEATDRAGRVLEENRSLAIEASNNNEEDHA